MFYKHPKLKSSFLYILAPFCVKLIMKECHVYSSPFYPQTSALKHEHAVSVVHLSSLSAYHYYSTHHSFLSAEIHQSIIRNSSWNF